MNVYEATQKRRTIRKFKQQEVPQDTLMKLVNAARVAPQGANLQPVKYVVIDDPALLQPIFTTIKWAAYITPAGNPQEDEKPTAYVVILVDSEIKKTGYDVDAGAAVENMLLTAVGEGLGSCWLGAIDRDQIRNVLSIPERYIIHTVVALGYPAEDPVVEDENGSIKYHKDANGVLHVPKRKMEDVVFHNKM